VDQEHQEHQGISGGCIQENLDTTREELIQRIKYELFEGTKRVFLTGSAGTGKSTLVREISEGTNPIVTSTTGVSAVNIGGQTAHSFFKLGISGSIEELKSSDRDIMRKFRMHTINRYLSKMNKAIQSADFIIIDEVSMLNGSVMDMIQYRLQGAGCPDKPILFTGDLLQLPPVEGDPILNNEFFKGAAVFNLNRVHRTDDPDFQEFAASIRYGLKVSDNHIKVEDYLISKGYTGQNLDQYVQIFPTTREVQSENERMLNALQTESKIYTPDINRRGNKVRPDEIQTYMQNAKIEQSLELKIGAQVIITRNSACENYVNGDVAIITALHSKSIDVVLTRDGSPRRIEYAEFDKVEFTSSGQGELNRKVKWTVKALPIMLGWAITIHKSQGAGIDKLYIKTQNLFARSQFYVAISRSSNPQNLIIDYGHSCEQLLETIPYINEQARDFYQNIPDKDQYY